MLVQSTEIGLPIFGQAKKSLASEADIDSPKNTVALGSCIVAKCAFNEQ